MRVDAGEEVRYETTMVSGGGLYTLRHVELHKGFVHDITS